MSYTVGEVRGVLRCYTALTSTQIGGDFHVKRIDLQNGFLRLPQRVKHVLYLVGVCDYEIEQAAHELDMSAASCQAIWTGGVKLLMRHMNRRGSR